MRFAHDDYVVETFSPNAAVQPLRIRTLPGAVRRSEHLLNTHVLDVLPKPVTVDFVAITQQILWCCIPGKYLHHLLLSPCCSRVLCYAKVNDLSPVNREDQEYVESLEANRWNKKDE